MPPPSTVSFKALLSTSLRNWMPGLFLSAYAKGAALQTGTSPNLDTLRGTTPQLPLSYAQGSLPAASYLDPKPTNNANLNYYFTQLTEPNNPSGPIGALPMQAPDPTAGASVVGGLSVDMVTRQFNWTAPVMSLAGRAGLNLGLALSYSSNVWIGDSNNKAFNTDRGFPGPGWRIGFGSILWENPPTVWGHVNQTTGTGSVMYLAPDGTRHTLKNNPANGRWESYDSTYLSLDLNNGIMTAPNGMQIHFGPLSISPVAREYQSYVDKITDRNGNVINISYKTLSNESFVPDYAIDTAGRRIDFEYTNNRLTGVKQMRGATAFYYVRIDHAPVTIQGVTGNVDPPGLNGSQVYLPSKLTYPTGVNFRFSYNDKGVMNSIAKWVPTITGQGSERAIASCTFAQGTFFTRTEWAENWQGGSYAYDQTTGGGWVVTDPSGRMFDVHINGMVYTQRIRPNSSGGAIKVTYMTYAQDAGLSYRSNPRVVESKVVDVSNQNNTRRATTSYTQAHGVWLPSELIEYTADTTTVYRKTVTSYLHYPAQRIIGLPQKVAVYNAANTKLAETENVYDELGGYTDSNNQSQDYLMDAAADNVIQHDNTNYGFSFKTRGNLTRTLQYYGGTGTGTRTVKYVSYDTNGNVRATADGAKNRSQILYTDNYSNKPAGVGATGVYPYTAANPIGFSGGAQFNYYTGQALQTFNLLPGGTTPQQVVTTVYDFADRPLTTTRPDGGQVATQYWDNYLASGTRQLVEGANRFKWDIYDGAGRAYKKAADHPDAITQKFSGQITAFNNIGEVTDTSNTIAINGNFVAAFEDASPGFLFTHLTYDAMGKLEEVMRPDGNHVDYDREGCGCAGNMTTRVTDELGVTTESQTDFLGRLKIAREPINSWQDYSRAEYTYNELDQLTVISAFNSSGSGQSRAFYYDGYGRLGTEVTPEAGTVSYSYKDNDQLATKTDARNITASYTYNTRGLMTNVTYSDPTPGVSIGYDDYGARVYNSNAEETVYYGYTDDRKPYWESHYFAGHNWLKAYNLVYVHNNADQLKNVWMLAYDSVNGAWQEVNRKQVNYAYKTSGALSGVGTNMLGNDPNATTNVLSNTSFRATGAIKQLDYGNGLRLEMGYSAQRQQPTSMKVAPVSNPNAPVLSYGYNYYDANSQNNNRIRKITDNVDNNYTTEYGYDAYNRLYVASAGNNSRLYTYDPWGNLRTTQGLTVYGYQPLYTINIAMTGGPGGGAPLTNRIQNVVEGGQTFNHTYDAAGNLTNDGQKAYAYDGAGRMTSVNAGALGTYGYNGDGKRVRKVEGGATTYYVYSSVLGGAAFELNGTGAVNRVHVTAGGKEIAQLATDGAFYWLHTDHLGTPRRMTNSTGVVMFRGEYDPHGNSIGGWDTISNNKFTGYERDAAAGLDFAQARHYKFGRGRFMQPDPIGLKSSNRKQPQSLNLYAYVGNDPINYTDPSGTLELVTPPPYLDQARYACESHGGTFQIIAYMPWGPPQWGCVGAKGAPFKVPAGVGQQGNPVGTPQENISSKYPQLAADDQKKVDDALAKAIEIADFVECDTLFADKGIPSLKALVSNLKVSGGNSTSRNGQNVFDGRRATDLTGTDSNGAVRSIASILTDPGTRAVTHQGAIPAVFLGDTAFSGDTARLAITLLHESIHVAGYGHFGMSSADLSNLLIKECLAD